MEKPALEDDHMCFACGKNNPSGLKLKFFLHADNTLTAEFIPQKDYQGFRNLVHGGVISLILDEAMANLNWKLGKSTLTGQLEVRFKNPAKIGERLFCKARIISEDKKIVYNEAVLTTDNSKIVAIAKAKCVKIFNQPIG